MDEKLKNENAALKKEVALYKEILNNIPQGIYITDVHGEIKWVNNTLLKVEDKKEEDIIGKNETEVYSDFENDLSQKVIRTGKSYNNAFNSYFTKQGKKMDILSDTYPFFFDGTIERVYSIGYHIGYSEQQLIRVLEHRQKQLHNENKADNGTTVTLDHFIGEDPSVRSMLEVTRKIAAKNVSVMIHGNTGTGKEIIAQGIHNASTYREGRFVALNCATTLETLVESILFGSVKGAYTGAIDRKGLIEEAENGTLFLDEVNSLSPAMQGMLLRVLQEKKYTRVGGSKTMQLKCRIICATNQDLLELVEKDQFRQDLFFRLAGVTIQIPPLEERINDIPLLIDYIIEKSNEANKMEIKGIVPQCMEVFRRYSWPGNVRELEHVVEYMMSITADKHVLQYKDLPPYLIRIMSEEDKSYIRYLDDKKSLKQITDDFQKDIVTAALEKQNGNITQTAKDLGISRETLHYYIKKYKIKITL